jgi:hypothetical protein
MRPCAASVAPDPGAESFDGAFVEAVAGDRRAATAQRGRRASRSAAIERGGKILHNDFEPFIRIAKRWGEDVFPGSLDRLNDWSGGG